MKLGEMFRRLDDLNVRAGRWLGRYYHRPRTLAVMAPLSIGSLLVLTILRIMSSKEFYEYVNADERRWMHRLIDVPVYRKIRAIRAGDDFEHKDRWLTAVGLQVLQDIERIWRRDCFKTQPVEDAPAVRYAVDKDVFLSALLAAMQKARGNPEMAS